MQPNLPTAANAHLPQSYLRKHAAPAVRATLLRAASYGRFSSSMQRETSIERQFECNDEYIEAMGWTKAGEWADRAVGGAQIAGRDGLLAMLEDAERGEFDRLVIEEIDRLGRDLGILGSVHRQLTELGIEVHTTQQRRKLDASDVAMRGLQAQETRTLLAYRSQKGRDQCAREGRTTAVWYGVEVGAVTGTRTKVPANATVVERIYRLRCEGLSGGAVADALNADGVPSPKGGRWASDTVMNVVANPANKGLLVYKRTSNQKRYTGKKVVKARPVSEWIVEPAEQWRIVSDEVWERAQSAEGTKRAQPAKRTYLLSRLVHCPDCGRHMTILPQGRTQRLRCSGNHRTKACATRDAYRLATVEREVVEIVRAHLDDPRLEREYAIGFEEERRRLARDAAAAREGIAARIAELDGFLQASFFQGLVGGIPTETLVGMREGWGVELAGLRERLEGLPSPPRVGAPAPERLATLREACAMVLGDAPFRPVDEAGHRVMALFRELVAGVTIQRDGFGRGYRLAVESRLQSVLQGNAAPGEAPTLGLQGRWVSGRTRGSAPRGEVERMIQVANSGVMDLDDRTWAIVRPTVVASVTRNRRPVPEAEVRSAVDALFFMLRTGFPTYRSPDRYGLPHVVNSAINQMIRHGGWDAMAAALRAGAPGFLDGVEVAEAERRQRLASVAAVRKTALRRASRRRNRGP